MTSSAAPAATPFEIATWYDPWPQTGLANLTKQLVPLDLATRYNLAFGQLVPSASGAYTISMTGAYAAAVKQQILSQAPNVTIYAGLGDTGISEAVLDNQQNNNRSTASIVNWLLSNGYHGICIDAEGSGMSSVATLVSWDQVSRPMVWASRCPRRGRATVPFSCMVRTRSTPLTPMSMPSSCRTIRPPAPRRTFRFGCVRASSPAS